MAMNIMMPNFKVAGAEAGIYPFSSLNLDISTAGPAMAPFWGADYVRLNRLD
jgi:hypothetical protein